MTAIAMVPVSRRVGGPVPKRVKRRDQDGDTQRLNDPLRLTCYTFGADVMGYRLATSSSAPSCGPGPRQSRSGRPPEAHVFVYECKRWLPRDRLARVWDDSL